MRVSIGLDLFEEGYKLNFCSLYLRLPIKAREPKDIMETWGIGYFDKALTFRWGTKYKMFWMPWDWGSCVRWEVMNEAGELVKIINDYEPNKAGPYKDGRKVYTSDYTYTLRSGEIQKRIAWYYVDEMEWRWRIFRKLRIGPKMVRRCISINFSDEVGEGTGSWKGGVLGCGYSLLPGETPEQCLRRMEKERKFAR